MLHSTASINMLYTTVEPLTNTSIKIRNLTAYQVVYWIFIDNVCVFFLNWSLSDDCGTINWQLSNTLTYQSTATLFPVLFSNHPITQIDNTLLLDYVGIDAMFILYHCGQLTK